MLTLTSLCRKRFLCADVVALFPRYRTPCGIIEVVCTVGEYSTLPPNFTVKGWTSVLRTAVLLVKGTDDCVVSEEPV